ncbi:MAG: hydroxymethylglutaryl-CoA lyase [Betaproteobacteria bacterium]|jgi:hydroxymethylglutaryl-CoA lyase|nr:hydroxymethylglutaryl-CoA lyase [Betaproteobacteria bacterium]
MNIPKKVRIVEVGPRDGLQNEARPVPAAVKIELIDRLTDAGLPVIEATAFVSPKWVPQMADNAEVMAGIRRKPGVVYPVLVPNRKGLDAAIAAGAEEIVVFGAATESFSKRNTNCSIDEGLARFSEVCEEALRRGLKVRGDISVCLGCPYEGEVAPEAVVRVARALAAMGCYEITICDTIGTGTAGATRQVVEAVATHIAVERLAGHFHDTYGQAVTNVYAALECGIATFDSSVAGLGGCPYAKGATGNVATEDVLYMLNGLGIETGIDMDKLIAAGAFISSALGRPTHSRVAKALAAKVAA